MAEPGWPVRSQSVAGTWPVGRPASAGGLAPAGSGLWPAIVETLRGWGRAEAGAGRLLPWVPVAFGGGIALYFAADHEPVLWVVAATAIALALGAVLLRRSRLFAPAIMIAAVAAGFAVATWKTARIAHTVLAKSLYSVSLSGFVETRDIRERTDRFVLRVTAMEAQRSDVKLERVRLSVRKGTAPEVGSFVQLKARLMPPISPVRPGSYDFSRDMFFQGIGASGFVMGAIAASVPPDAGGLRLRYAAIMQGLRDAIDARIRATLDGDNRAIATALLTGRRDAITTPVNDAMFISGLGHVLSISGYHMAVVAGVVFFAVRALLALIPGLAVGFAIKKWSAAAALVAAAFYLLLSGAEVATQRSFFMTAVVLIAVMVDRRAITFRTLAVAALIVLAVAPESLVHPSFQMSFAATLGLVALVQIGMPNLFVSPDHSATARIALVMPAGLLGLIAAPFGLDGVFWWLMGIGIDWMIAVSRWVAALPGAIGRIPAFGIAPLIAASLGIIVMGLLRTPLRWSGGLLLLAAIAWGLFVRQPDILIAGDGQSVAVRGRDGHLHLIRASRDSFLLKEWLAADADPRGAGGASLSDGVSCDESGCVTPLADGRLVALALRIDALADDCSRAALVVTARPAPPDCAAMVVDRLRLSAQGALALTQRGDGFAVQAMKARGTDRPWSPATAGEADFGASLAPQVAAPRNRDATPSEADLQAED
ncbi:ComEC/Rec2 family competence protein [Bradyrhizobium sp. A5]|uniref:ComEC/Rec2 family competence protein n=1 Tax=Bradyrhizobium sp. A5 TaxID=3133696 RepID=UPI00324B966E